MSRKARKQLLRERDRQRKQREEQIVEEKVAKLKQEVGGFSRTPLTDEVRAKIRRVNSLGTLSRLVANRVVTEVSRPKPIGTIKYRSKPTYTGDMLERERRALERYEVMKSHTMPIGNKMGPQYVPPDSLDAADVRAGNTKRR